ncbi:hypothetical protein FD967_03730 [Polynucleobacter sp. JS-Mosq-20-D10]|uniref:hypothetical protein n=1 Tax=Polynucleobacter sp. JS-Mosq-20-D10 TaxID=2576922 RepID=UPI001BFE75C4|nr:hypothetical protein [Polynucleobacter sp. JS-Mosq-20-D10]QWE01161.1 hypothetical protein FD967_03730 [Polynucleobacter sp. JS-Mosq-20-D10]
MSKSLLQSELAQDIEQLLIEGTGGIDIVTQDGKKLTLSVFPTALYPLKSRIDDLPLGLDD